MDDGENRLGKLRTLMTMTSLISIMMSREVGVKKVEAPSKCPEKLLKK
jgi:hypothetical protein